MFWHKIFGGNKSDDVPDEDSASTLIHVAPIPIKVDSFEVRRSVLDWRDQHLAEIEMRLREEFSSLMGDVEAEVTEMGFFESTFMISKAKDDIVQPLFEKWLEKECQLLFENAQKELDTIHGLVLIPFEPNPEIDHAASNSSEYQGAALAALSGIGAAAAIPAFSSASVVSAGGLLGLLGATTISIPIAATGVVVFSGAVLFSGYKISNLKEWSIERFCEGVKESMKTVLFEQTRNGDPSITSQLQLVVEEASQQIIQELDS